MQRVHRGSVQCRVLLLAHRGGHAQRGTRATRPVQRGSTRHDPVVVFRVALRALQSLAATSRAANPVRLAGGTHIEIPHHLLRRTRHLVHGAIAEVDHLLRMSQREPAAATLVPGVGGGRGIAALQPIRQRRVGNAAGKAPIAHAQQLAVPALQRQPHLDADIRSRRGMQRRHDAAERGQSLQRHCAFGLEGTRGYHLPLHNLPLQIRGKPQGIAFRIGGVGARCEQGDCRRRNERHDRAVQPARQLPHVARRSCSTSPTARMSFSCGASRKGSAMPPAIHSATAVCCSSSAA